MSGDIAALVSENLDVWTGAVERRSGAGRGGRGKLSLYGIERLRALILDLAVRGKLVPQDAGDEPAPLLLKRIDRCRAKLAEGGFLRGEKIDADRSAVEGPFSIPTSWTWTRLARLGAIVGGGTPSANDPTNFTGPGQGIAWLTPADLSGFEDKYICRGQRDLTDRGLNSSSAKMMPAGTVLFTSRAPIGYVAIAGNPISTNQGFKSIVLPIEGMSEFVALALKAFAEEIDANAPGTTFKEVSGKIVGAIPFPLPPLAEQQRIVAKVDELMALCDALEAQSASAIEAHQTLVETLLATLVDSADPVTNWTGLGTHFDTLFSTDASVDALKSTVTELAIIGRLSGAGPIILRSKPLQDLLIFGPKNGVSPRAVEHDTGIRSLSLSATTQGRFDDKQYKYVDIELPEPDSELWLKNGDVLIQRANSFAYVGVAALYEGQSNSFIYPDLMMKLRFSEEVNPKFGVICLNSKSIRDYFRSKASGTSGSMPKINRATVLNATLPLPSLAEQHRIVAKVDQLMALCDTLKARIAEASETERHLADAIVERAAA